MENLLELEFEPLSRGTIDACIRIGKNAPDPWQDSAYDFALSDVNHWTFVAIAAETPIAFASFLAVAGSCDLEMVVVDPEARRLGVAKRLLIHSFKMMRAQGVERCLLEVRASNARAIALYKGFGFKTLATRPGVFSNPADDGLLMAVNLR